MGKDGRNFQKKHGNGGINLACVYTLGADIGGTNLRLGIVSSEGETVSFERKASSVLHENAAKGLAEEINGHIAKNGYTERISAVAVGLPSLIDKSRSTVLSTPNLKGFDKLPLKSELEKILGIPVFIERDVNFLLQNDMEKLGLKSEKTVLGFYVGTGFGNSIFMGGKFYTGSNGAAGELGHIPILGSNMKCTCGNTGCIETVCSGKALEALAEEHFPHTNIKQVFKVHGNEPILKAFVYNLAVPIATEINILDPDVCIIGGGVIDMECFPKEILSDAVHFYTRKPYPEKSLRLLFTRHDQKSGVFGSGIFAQKQIMKRGKPE